MRLYLTWYLLYQLLRSLINQFLEFLRTLLREYPIYNLSVSEKRGSGALFWGFVWRNESIILLSFILTRRVCSLINFFLRWRSSCWIHKSCVFMHKCRPMTFVYRLLNLRRKRIFICNYLGIWIMKDRICFSLECLILLNIIINGLSKWGIGGALHLMVGMEYRLLNVSKHVKRRLRRILSTSLGRRIRLIIGL